MKTKKHEWTHSQLGKNVFSVDVKYNQNKEWEYWFLLTSDQHWDNPHSNHELQLKHLELAKERNAGIMSAGDYFCMMQGKYDKRASKASVRPEHQVDNYIDAIIKTGADFLEPYAKQFVVIATGNHEQSISDKLETNVIDRFCGVLNDRTGSTIRNGGYSGYIIFKFSNESCCNRFTTVLRYEHGAGGAAIVGGGIPDSYRRGVHFPDSDIILSGHNHNQWVNELSRQRLDRGSGTLKLDVQMHIKCPSYKDEYGIGFSGWHAATKGLPPKPIGAWWLRFYYERESKTRPHRRLLYEVIQAK